MCDEHLYDFHIYGKDYGTSGANTCSATLRQFHSHTGERFRYVYDYYAYWVCDIRLEATLPVDPQRFYPVCTGGKNASPSENFLVQDGLVFGGQQLTATDIAVAAGRLELGDVRQVASIDAATCQRVLGACQRMLEEAVDRVKTAAGDVPLVAVGGGAFLVPDHLAGVSGVIRVLHGDCANAVGAAMAQVSGEVDQIFRDLSRRDTIAAATALAAERAVAAGADATTLKTIETEDMPRSYLPGNSLRVRVRMVGDVASSNGMWGK